MTLAVHEPGLAVDIVAEWCESFGQAMSSARPDRIAAHFQEDSYWRDILAFTWDYRTHTGREAIAAGLAEAARVKTPSDFQISPSRSTPRLIERSNRLLVEGFVDFTTKDGLCTALVQLPFDADQPAGAKAWILLTTLQQLRGHEERVRALRPSGVEYSQSFHGDNWLDSRRKAQRFADRDPQVLIIGAGQSGLSLGARLGQLDVDTLIIERNARVGDNWRQRYHSLALHNPVWANHMAYLPFPETWPTFLPKDKVGDWLESYAVSMELNVWTSSRLLSCEFDDHAGNWRVELDSPAGGGARTLRPTHVVLATGALSGSPRVPSLPGLEDYDGVVLHSSEFTSGAAYAGQRAIVFGTGNSGHDVAQDLYSNGAAAVTLAQRSSTTVVSLDPSSNLLYALYAEGPVEDIDLVAAARPLPVMIGNYQRFTEVCSELDRELLDGLSSVGFETDFGVDNTGFHMKYLTTGGGYYIDVGCAGLIAAGKIDVVHARDMKEFTQTGLLMSDGDVIEADVVVLATGYEELAASVRRMFGDSVADRVGPIWGLNEQGFLRNMWTRTGQPNFWVMGGSFTECRPNSKYLAMLIKADLERILPPRQALTASTGRSA